MPKGWSGLKSDEDIDKDMVTDSRPKVKCFHKCPYMHIRVTFSMENHKLPLPSNI